MVVAGVTLYRCPFCGASTITEDGRSGVTQHLESSDGCRRRALRALEGRRVTA